MYVVVCTAAAGAVAPAVRAQQQAEDEWLARPLDDATFRSYLEFFSYDADLTLDVVTTAVDTADGITRERLSFASTPGQRVTAVLVRSEAASVAGQPAAILTHGGEARGKDAPGPQAYATLLAQAGWAVLAIDLWHYGERDDGLLGGFSRAEKASRLYSEHSNYLAFVTQTAKDVGRSVDFLIEERGVDADRIVYVGISRGAVVGTIVGAVEQRLAGVALLLPGHRSGTVASHVAAACPANYIGRISPRPLLMINGVYDAGYDKEKSVLPLQALAGEPKEFHWNEVGHALPRESTAATLLDWLRRVPPLQ